LTNNLQPPSHRGFFIGIDGGGTKTVGLLAHQTGHIIAKAESGASNYHAIGEEQTKQALSDVVSRLIADANAALESCVCCLGLAGVASSVDRKVIGRICDEIGLPENRILTHDAQIALIGGAEELSGVIIIAGTGSIVYGRDAAGREAQAGGWGHLLGDEGSGYDIARRAFQAVARAADGRGESTRLSTLMLDALEFSQPRNLIPWMHSVGKDKVAQLAGVVFHAADADDSVAQSILGEAADELVLATGIVIDKLRFSQPFNLVLCGGIFTHQPTFVASLRSRLQNLSPDARVSLPKREPAYGAILLAQAQFSGE
jgi:N-acetylglucosamine kinase